ncbi:type I polyketide synthase [Thermoflavimicrobium daqui]|uniref:SDR family NAD(P)-dependent oxidoreductase n=1 Tax=Thermoflavimicrobium daqui TaxID=2137476 RepID=A0A364K3A6_9BACL|nr:type I polyketide synthase [Thermoflavimicrobium daqui]RAL23312.1 hypothetical protein DL897_11485 [Thermoflavimicrobium daqui]
MWKKHQSRELSTKKVYVNEPLIAKPIQKQDINRQLRTLCESILPAYMVPNEFVVLDRLPRTPNNKIDRKALQITPSNQAEFLEIEDISMNDLENIIANVWRKVLGKEKILRNQSFFELGGSSLLLALVHAQLRDVLKRDIKMVDLLNYPTIEELARKLAHNHLNESIQPDSLTAKHDLLDHTQMDAIAVVGMGCRFPGDISSPEEFWNLLEQERNAIVDIPLERWDIHAFYDQELKPGKMNIRRGGFLKDIDQFDASLFGISPSEAASMDPQHRILLEVVWEALENSGMSPDLLRGSATGVFMGLCANEYRKNTLGGEATQIDAWSGTGIVPSMVSGRISYLFDFHGPSITIDTACSSSLVAVHMACQSLRSRETDLALAGGVTLILDPNVSVYLSQINSLSPEGHCKPFDASANGFVRSEGCGVVVLKRLSDALRDGDLILSVIRGSAVNQDGRSSSLTAPNGLAQQEVVRRALQDARLEPEDITYIEAHGTGTALGDPIEVDALAKAYGSGHSKENPLLIGSVKSNIGHTEAAAGIAGLMKLILSLKHKRLPKTLHFSTPNPYIPWSTLPIQVVDQMHEWHSKKTRRGAVSSFGFSGTNAHVIVEEFVQDIPNEQERKDRSLHLLILSGHQETVIPEMAKKLYEYLIQKDDWSVGDVCSSLIQGRAHLAYRVAVPVKSKDDLLQALVTLSEGKKLRGALQNEGELEESHKKVAFLFSGQGTQYLRMGQLLYEEHLVFKEMMDRCSALFEKHLGWSMIHQLYHEENPESLHDTEKAQSVLFALELSLAKLWLSWGIDPDVLIGHSIGEICAAYIADVMDLEDAVKLVAARGRLMSKLPAGGGMISIRTAPDELEKYLDLYKGELGIAAVNGPKSTVLSGKLEVLDMIAADLKEKGIRVDTLSVSHAFHSPLMEPMLAEFRQVLNTIRFRPARRKIISTVDPQGSPNLATVEYWVQHVCSTVNFEEAIQCLDHDAFSFFIEVGPQPTLLGMVADCMDIRGKRMLPSLRKNRNDWSSLLGSLANLYVSGVSIDWKSFDQPYRRRPIPLPTYSFKRQRYWIDITEPDHFSHPLLTSLTKEKERGELAQQLVDELQVDKSQIPLVHNILNSLLKHMKQDTKKDHWQKHTYVQTWKPVELITDHLDASGSWIILGDDENFIRQVADQVEQRGGEVIIPDRPLDANHFRNRSVRSVIYTFESTVDEVSPQEMLSQVEQAVKKVSRIVNISGMYETKVWIVTKNAWGNEKDDLSTNPVSASLWGLGVCASLERFNIWGGRIDLSSSVSEQELKLCLAAMTKGLHGEDSYRIQADRAFVLRLDRKPSLPSQPIKIRSDVTYLITGGTGALGLKMAYELAKSGAKSLVLLSRGGSDSLNEKSQNRLRIIEELGTQIHIVKADVTNEVEMNQAFIWMNDHLPPLAGIIHAAGVSSHIPVVEIENKSIKDVISPKVKGTWILHQLTKEMALDWFVCFSSISAVWGTEEGGHYAAANAFLQGFVKYRQERGLPASNVSWGPWAGGGMAEGNEELLTQLGIKPMDPDIACAALKEMGMSKGDGFVVANVNWETFIPIYQARKERKLFSLLEDQQEKVDTPVNRPHLLKDRLSEEDSDQRLSLLQHWLIEKVSDLLGDHTSIEVNEHIGFFDLGLDSLMAVELRNRLQMELDLILPPTITFNYPNISSLSSYLMEELGWKNDMDSKPLEMEKTDMDQELGQLEEMSVEELLELVENELRDGD